jgi:hypothetical protein
MKALTAAPLLVAFVALSCSEERAPQRAPGDNDGERAPASDAGLEPVAIVSLDPGPDNHVCRSDDDCPDSDVCCFSASLGVCQALEPGAACPRPDLAVFVANDWRPVIRERLFGGQATACELDMGCVGGFGLRRLLEFSVEAANLGAADLILGVPGMTGITQSGCAAISYSTSFLIYELSSTSGARVAQGMGVANQCTLRANDAVPSAFTDCSILGMRRYSYQTYEAGSFCQWIDITTVGPGDYELSITINREGVELESNKDNNRLVLPVHIAERDPLAACLDPDPLLFPSELECGWALVPDVTNIRCTPGERSSVVCRSEPYAPILRACAGAGACSSGVALTLEQYYESPEEAAASPCGDDPSCIESRFDCPSSGTYTFMYSLEANATATCAPVPPV